jgi:hypothetical protein
MMDANTAPDLHGLQNDRALERLDPDLLPYVCQGGLRDPLLHHPLVIQGYAEAQNKSINDLYHHKKQACEAARASGDWSQFIDLHERPYRCSAFKAVMDQMTDTEYWTLLGDIYTDSENLSQWSADLRTLLGSPRAEREQFMPEADRDELGKIVARGWEITAYRGYSMRKLRGWSWTVSKARAVWFARRSTDRGARVAEATVRTVDIIAYLGERGEQELVLDPTRIKVTRTYRVTKADR